MHVSHSMSSHEFTHQETEAEQRQLAHTDLANEPEVRLGAVLTLLKMCLSCPMYEMLRTHKDLLLVPKPLLNLKGSPAWEEATCDRI